MLTGTSKKKSLENSSESDYHENYEVLRGYPLGQNPQNRFLKIAEVIYALGKKTNQSKSTEYLERNTETTAETIQGYLDHLKYENIVYCSSLDSKNYLLTPQGKKFYRFVEPLFDSYSLEELRKIEEPETEIARMIAKCFVPLKTDSYFCENFQLFGRSKNTIDFTCDVHRVENRFDATKRNFPVLSNLQFLQDAEVGYYRNSENKMVLVIFPAEHISEMLGASAIRMFNPDNYMTAVVNEMTPKSRY